MGESQRGTAGASRCQPGDPPHCSRVTGHAGCFLCACELIFPGTCCHLIPASWMLLW